MLVCYKKKSELSDDSVSVCLFIRCQAHASFINFHCPGSVEKQIKHFILFLAVNPVHI